MKKLFGGIGVCLFAVVAMAGTAFAHDCTNASKNLHAPTAGNQVVLDSTGNIVESATKGVLQRIDHGIIDPANGDGLHGLIGFDFDGDGIADVSTYIVGPNAALPDTAQSNGSPCHGVTSLDTYGSQCLAPQP